jgi:hypothetical protein
MTRALLTKLVIVLTLVIALLGTALYRYKIATDAAMDRMKKSAQMQDDGLKNMQNAADHYEPK